MYEREYGYRYDEVADDSSRASDIAKRIRADIKQAVAEGLLPARWSYSVRSESFSGGQSIDVRVKGCADAWVQCDGTKPGTLRTFDDGSSVATACPNVWCKAREDQPGADYHDVLSADADAAKMTLERIHSAYNHDGSEIMVDYHDVRYYGQVTFQDARSADFEASEKARKAAKRQALDSATDVRVVIVHGRSGSTSHLAAEVEGKVRLLCGATLWRSSFVSEAAEGSAVSCSRCARRKAGA